MFELNPAAINWPRAVMVPDVMLVSLVVFWAIGHEEYLLSALFGGVFTSLADPGGSRDGSPVPAGGQACPAAR